MAKKKESDGIDRWQKCQLCDASKATCAGFYQRDKGLPGCCFECSHPERT